MPPVGPVSGGSPRSGGGPGGMPFVGPAGGAGGPAVNAFRRKEPAGLRRLLHLAKPDPDRPDPGGRHP